MQAVSIKESHSGRGSDLDTERLGASRIFTVEFGTIQYPSVAETATGPGTDPDIPKWGDPYPGDTRRIATRIRADQMGSNPYMFEVRVDYALQLNDQDPTDDNINPIYRDAGFSWAWESTEEEIDTDVNGKAIRTTAGEIVHLKVNYYDLVFRYTKNVALFPAAMMWEYPDTVNSDPFVISNDVGKWLLRPFTGNRVEDAKWGNYFALSFEMVYRKYYQVEGSDYKSGWYRRWLQEGIMRRVGNNQMEQINDKEGIPVTRPVPLDWAGQPQFDGDAPPLWEYTQVKFEKPWGSYLNGLLFPAGG